MSRRVDTSEIYFFCDNCSLPQLSKRHTVTLTAKGMEIVKDLCSHCGVVQEIESVGSKNIETYRIRADEAKRRSDQNK